MIKSPVTARDSVNPVSLRINFSVVKAKTFLSFFLFFLGLTDAGHCGAEEMPSEA